MKVVSIVGARPQFIKLTPVAAELRKAHEQIIVHTGQHYGYELSQLFFKDLKIPQPDYNLGVGSGSHGYQIGQTLQRAEKVFEKEKPEFVLAFGDTNSTVGGALAARKLNIPLGHVEAGMRIFDKSMPEEINRILTDHCSDLLFSSTKTAVSNLRREGFVKGVYLTGDVLVDALLQNKEIAESSTILEKLDLELKDYLVATVHRENNTNNRKNLSNIVEAFCEIDSPIVFPAHPRTVKFLKTYGLYRKLEDVINIIEPLGYFAFLKLIKHAKKVLTDSGGVQKETYILKVPCITLREKTEWVETVEDGWNILVTTDKDRIIEAVERFRPKGKQHEYFGRGNASQRIVRILDQYF